MVATQQIVDITVGADKLEVVEDGRFEHNTGPCDLS